MRSVWLALLPLELSSFRSADTMAARPSKKHAEPELTEEELRYFPVHAQSRPGSARTTRGLQASRELRFR